MVRNVTASRIASAEIDMGKANSPGYFDVTVGAIDPLQRATFARAVATGYVPRTEQAGHAFYCSVGVVRFSDGRAWRAPVTYTL